MRWLLPLVACSFNSAAADSPRVCLLSLELGVGINLIGANHLIMLSPSYNPADDIQAMARIHRGGMQPPPAVPVGC